MRTIPLFLMCALAYAPAARAQAVEGNLSVLANPLSDLGAIALGDAFAYEFVAEVGPGAHAVDQVGFYQLFYDDAGGDDRNYTIGLKEGTADGGPAEAWLGSRTFTHCCTAGALWYRFDLSASLAGGARYFLVLEAVDAKPDNVIHLAASTPPVGRVPYDQKVSARRVWKRSGGAWAVVPDREPIFFVRYAEADPGAAASCAATARYEGNPYTHLASLGATTTVPVSQSFFLERDLQAAKVAVVLSSVAGTGALDLEIGDVAASAVLATVPLAATATTVPEGTVYEGILPNLVLRRSATPGEFTYRLTLRLPTSRTASWQAVSSASSPAPADVCTEFARLSFGGGRGVATVGTEVRSEQDALFWLTACTPVAWYRDADGDGAGDPASAVPACTPPGGHVAAGTDCDDGDPHRHPDRAEDCDGKDNDCDGATDEALAAPACGLASGVCAGARKSCAGAAGWAACGGAEYGADWEAAETRCDGLDNDCDGATDRFEVVPACTRRQGVCAGREQSCAGAGWVDCAAGDYGADFEPAETRCDGLDNDCNGAIDDLAPGSLPACERQQGVCAGATPRCVGGRPTACDAVALAAHSADFEEVESRCDGLDNDCDGRTDPAALCPGRPPTPVFDLGGCGCGAGGAPLLLLAALAPLGLGRRLRR